MKYSQSELTSPNIIGPFPKWEDIPSNVLLKIITSPIKAYIEDIVIRPSTAEFIIRINQSLTYWDGKTPPDFTYEILPNGFSVTLTQG